MKSTLLRALPVLALSVACMAFDDDAKKPKGGEFPDNYFFYAEKRPQALRDMEGKAPPALTVKDWIGDKQDLESLRGKVVIVDFWGTWCPPCMKSLPHNVEMYDKHHDEGLMIIGVHDSKKGVEKMASVAADKKIKYPLAVDDATASQKAWHISFWPTYVVIDRAGIVRAAGLTPDNVDKVIAKLLKEPAPEKPKTPSKPAAPTSPSTPVTPITPPTKVKP